jgi:dTDP-glucose 4,6-dehydratase
VKIFVTGGAGFIGSHYVRSLLSGDIVAESQPDVTVLDKLTYAGVRENLPATHRGLRFVRGDICDRALLMDLLPGHDAVVHFAAESHVDRSLGAPAQFVRTNVLGTQTLLDAALYAGVQRVVHVSTDEVYGSIAEGSWTEGRPLLPNSPYSASKAGSDLIAHSYWRTHGLHVSMTRCCNNYGPYQHPEKLIPLFVSNLLEGIPVPLYGDGRNRREWLHVDDHCRAVQLVLTRGRAGEVYNVGGCEIPNIDLARRIVELCGFGSAMIRHVADRKGHDLRYSVDDTKIREQLGYSSCIPFEKGLAETVAWYRNNPEWWKTVKYREAKPASAA